MVFGTRPVNLKNEFLTVEPNACVISLEHIMVKQLLCGLWQGLKCVTWTFISTLLQESQTKPIYSLMVFIIFVLGLRFTVMCHHSLDVMASITICIQIHEHQFSVSNIPYFSIAEKMHRFIFSIFCVQGFCKQRLALPIAIKGHEHS